MSDASLRRDWRLWEGGRDEDALRRYVWALCREAPPTPERQSCVPRENLIDAHMRPLTSFRFVVVRSYVTCSRTVTAPIRRLTVCGPWLPGGIRGWVYRLGWRGMNLPYDERWIDRSEETTLLPVISNP